MKKLFLFVALLQFGFNAIQAQTHLSAKRSDVDEKYAPFYHGVASGDPLDDRVIIWTRVTTNDASVTVDWKMATDTGFTNIIQSGTTTTDGNKDFTVKIDVTGLQADTWYYYRFEALGKKSLTGRTRTAPTGNVANLRFAVMSCSSYESGYFNAYNDVAVKNDVDAVIHLGDYIYEYGQGGILSNGDSNRRHQPPHEILTLSDYRIRHSLHKLDPDLRAVHQQYPFITVWDDHETANNSWRDGAENHTPGTEGNWEDRKNYGRTAYFEWMPIRDVHGNNQTIYRTIQFGDLATFIMIDTRLEGRDLQSGSTNTDTNRTILGHPQLNWLRNELSAAASQWKLIGNQVMVGSLKLGSTVLNTDQWDGYPAERTKVLSHIGNNNINNVVVLTGDIHTSWANDLAADPQSYNSQTGAGSVAVEMVATSVTSTGFPFQVPLNLIQNSNPHIKYAELTKRGYLLLDLTSQQAQGDWVYMSTVMDKNYTALVGASWKADNNANHLTQASGALSPRTNRPLPAPDLGETSSGISNSSNPVMLSCYPNPFEESITLQYYLRKPGDVEIRVTDISGRIIYNKRQTYTDSGLCKFEIDMDPFPTGNYTVWMSNDDFKYSKVIFKSR
jgi:alkaline phosphatase D